MREVGFNDDTAILYEKSIAEANMFDENCTNKSDVNKESN